MRELEYPFDNDLILQKKKSFRRELMKDGSVRIKKNIAILGGSTTALVAQILDLFLLNAGIEATFYESEYNQFYEDACFKNPELESFGADVFYIHTSIHNINYWPSINDSPEEVLAKEDKVFNFFKDVWENLEQTKAVIIQNNFEMPTWRLLGNKDATDIHGRVHFVSRLNERFAEYAERKENLFIHDVNYLSACAGLEQWCDSFYWNMYKYCPQVSLMPNLCFSVANIIKSIYGKNKKALVLDLDNTLWGGIIGDDGPENVKVGAESSEAETFLEFQQYVKAQKDIGILLNIDSKNEYENALTGLNLERGALKPEDFLCIKANWEPKDRNLLAIAEELNLGVDSFVFVDDNPAERHIVREQVMGVSVPELTGPEEYIHIIDKSGFFEVTNLSKDDTKRNEMYKANMEREQAQSAFENYEDYLLSLEMKADIQAFGTETIPRISQLTNKSNQFNLTTLRCSVTDIEQMAQSKDWITLYGRLEDKFGDNGVVAVEAAELLPAPENPERREAHIRLNLMSCRVLKRDLEFAMLDELVEKAKDNHVETIIGYYYPTKKNSMVANLYTVLGFEEKEDRWELSVNNYQKQCKVISINNK
ncbi:MAG: HAD-IIIC family phosphatase [Lachnospiraceae bacterium]|nr:HAD-IIIC family phosphatase [Lachnospiraceae bacterium]